MKNLTATLLLAMTSTAALGIDLIGVTFPNTYPLASREYNCEAATVMLELAEISPKLNDGGAFHGLILSEVAQMQEKVCDFTIADLTKATYANGSAVAYENGSVYNVLYPERKSGPFASDLRGEYAIIASVNRTSPETGYEDLPSKNSKVLYPNGVYAYVPSPSPVAGWHTFDENCGQGPTTSSGLRCNRR